MKKYAPAAAPPQSTTRTMATISRILPVLLFFGGAAGGWPGTGATGSDMAVLFNQGMERRHSTGTHRCARPRGPCQDVSVRRSVSEGEPARLAVAVRDQPGQRGQGDLGRRLGADVQADGPAYPR